MGFFSSLYNKMHPEPTTTNHTTAESAKISEMALKKAKNDFVDVQNRRVRTTDVADRLREQGVRNHFAEMLEASMTREDTLKEKG